MSTYSNWREDLIEVIDIPTTEKKAEKKIKETKVNNKVVINPTFKEAVAEMGGQILEVAEVDDKKDTAGTKEDPQIKSKEKRAGMIKRQVLLKKLQAVRAGGGTDITAGYEPGGEMVEDYETKKTGEVLSAFKRDPKVRKRFEKAAKKEEGPGSVKNRAADSMLQTAKDTAKRKGDTSKSDDRYAYEEVVLEKDLNAAERRALPNKDFVFPGKGEGPEGKQRGAYPINDKKHARAALAMAAAHASPDKEAKVKAAVKKKYPDIEVSEGVMKYVKSICRKKSVKKATMDATTDKLHDWRQKNSKEQQDREKYVSPFRPIVKESDDKAYKYVVSKLKKQYGDGVLTKGDKIKPPTAAQKKAAAAHREKIAKQQAAEFKKDPSQGRYPPGYSNRGSD